LIFDFLAQGETMNRVLQFTAIIEREGDGYVSTCPELDIVSQGDTVEEARLNLLEAVEGFFSNGVAIGNSMAFKNGN
jgi:predicted RNase H-like HicB family nuclease